MMPTPCIAASRRGPSRTILVIVAAWLLTGCYVPAPKAHAELRIAADGSYTFNGRPAAPQELKALVEAARQPGADLVVQIDPAPAADMAAVRGAVEAVKSAQARVAFAKSSTDR